MQRVQKDKDIYQFCIQYFWMFLFCFVLFFFLEKMEYEAGCKIRDFPKYEWSFR